MTSRSELTDGPAHGSQNRAYLISQTRQMSEQVREDCVAADGSTPLPQSGGAASMLARYWLMIEAYYDRVTSPV